MGTGQGREPNRQARIGGAEAYAFFGQVERLPWSAAVKVHLPEQDISRGKAGIELDRLLERRDRTIGAARPHTDETERKMGVRIPSIESDGTLRQLIAFGIASLDVFRPPQI